MKNPLGAGPDSLFPAITGAVWFLAESDGNALELENERLRRMVMCVICKIRHRKILYMKCHHLAVCQVCDANVHHCPICGELVKAFLETEKSDQSKGNNRKSRLLLTIRLKKAGNMDISYLSYTLTHSISTSK